jgi:6-phosphogluconolactonase
MDVRIGRDGPAAAELAADQIAIWIDEACQVRGSASIAVSGGSTPNLLFASLAGRELPWHGISVFQVDERVAPDGHPDRNATALRATLLDRVPLAPEHVHLMPVTEPDLDRAAAAYARRLPPRFDVVHLGLGDDGHTASWPPGDPVTDVTDRDVAVVGPFNGRRRMTLTPPPVNRARAVVWLVAGASKAGAVAGLRRGDDSLPASHVRTNGAVLLVDRAAAGDAIRPR